MQVNCSIGYTIVLEVTSINSLGMLRKYKSTQCPLDLQVSQPSYLMTFSQMFDCWGEEGRREEQGMITLKSDCL